MEPGKLKKLLFNEKTLPYALFLQIFGLPIAIVVGIGGYFIHQHQSEQADNKKFNTIFKTVGVPYDKQEPIKNVILKQRGNCLVLSQELQQACNDTKALWAVQNSEKELQKESEKKPPLFNRPQSPR